MSDITAVIANFNYGRYLREAVDSALDEGAKVVVVDDGSTEPLPELPSDGRGRRAGEPGGGAGAKRRDRARRDPVRHRPRRGRPARRPARSRCSASPLDADPKLGFAYGRMRFFGDWEGELRFPPYDPYALLYRHTIGLSALVRRQVFEDTGGFDPAFGQFEDWELWVNALAHGWRGRQVEAVTVDYRRHAGSKHGVDRRAYRQAYRQLRAKHADLYRDSRTALGGELARLGRPPRSSSILGAEADPGERRAAALRPALAPKGRPSTMDKLRRSSPMTEPVTTASREAADPRLAGLRRLAIVPAYNEAEAIEAVISELRAFDPDFEIVVIDDGSIDGTGQREPPRPASRS